MFIQNDGHFEGLVEAGLRLSELDEAHGGWSEYFNEADGLDITDDMLRSHTTLMLENAKRWIGRICRGRRDEQGRIHIDEATRSAVVGGFSDYIFPIIRAAFPTNPINDLVSTQPTTRRNSTILFWNWVVGSQGKGSYTPGTRLWDAQRGKQNGGYNFSNEVIDAEIVGVGDDVELTFTGTLAFHDGGGIRPGTVKLTTVVSAATVVVSDNGNGGWLGGFAGSIDYNTGAFSITYGAAGNEVDDGENIVASYRWDSEGSRMLPEVDVQITTSTVETERRAIKLNYSMEAMQDIVQEFGISLEPNLIQGAAEHVNFETAAQIIAEIWAVAPVVDTFPILPAAGSGYNQQDHFKDLVFTLNTASNSIWSNTLKAYGNWLVVDQGAANVIESLPAGMFEKAPKPASVQGLHFIGTLQGQYRVYKYIHLGSLPGASAFGNILMGFKGSNFFEAGFVWSPYQLLYTTDTLTTADFISQKGMASRYATKMVNPDMFVRISLTAGG